MMILKENSFLNRYEWASEKIKHISDGQPGQKLTVYDIGSRDNILNGYIKDYPVSYKGFDLDPITDSAEKWDLEDPFPYTYPAPQMISMLEVIEHLNNPVICLKNIADVIAPGGYLILTTPNPKWSTSRVNLLAKGELACFSQSDLDDNHHVFIPWPHIVERFLTDAGFEIIEYATLDGKTNIFDKRLTGLSIIKRLFSRIVKKAIERRDPTSCGMSYGVVAKKSS
jgi:SAM-dependent methyltransferase